MFRLSLQLLSQKFLILRKIQRDIIKNVHRYSFKVPRYSCQILTKPEFSLQTLEESSITQLTANQSSGRRDVPCRRTERQV